MDEPFQAPVPQTGSVGPPRRAGEAPPGLARGARGIVRLLYCSNPFYVISAFLMLWGLYASFDAAGGVTQSGVLMTGLWGYTLVLAAAAVFLIRAGQVWDDVRTILLVIVLMFLAGSVTFDRTLAADAPLGTAYFLGGLLLSIAISEAVLFGIGLRLPVLFRLPYYLIMALFFLYPVALSSLLRVREHPLLPWALFGFPLVAGICFLTLLPAIRQGPRCVADSGSPWRWPLYPWVLFGVLGFAVGGRGYLLCVSFHPVPGTGTIFAPYFLVPFLLAVAVLVLEIGIVARSATLRWLALVAPLGLVALPYGGAGVGELRIAFHRSFVEMLGAGPLFVTLVALVGLYVWAMLRRVPGWVVMITVVLAALSVCGPRTEDLDSLAAAQGWPVMAVGLLQAASGLYRRSSAQCFLATCCLVAGASLLWRHTALMAYHGVVPAHVMLVAVLVLGASFRDFFARLLQGFGAALLLAAGLAAAALDPQVLGHPPEQLLRFYPVVLAAIALGYSFVVRWRPFLYVGLVVLTVWAGGRSLPGYVNAQRRIAGLNQIILAAGFFLLAFWISLRKAGLLPRWLQFRSRESPQAG